MEIPNVLRGHLYPTSRVSRCPRFHMCTVTKKCQNYDRHQLDCSVCESRTNAHLIDPESAPLGGHIPEGEYYPDLQDAMGQLEKRLQKPFAHTDATSQSINQYSNYEQNTRTEQITEMIRTFSSSDRLRIEEQIMHCLVDEDTRKLLGRLE